VTYSVTKSIGPRVKSIIRLIIPGGEDVDELALVAFALMINYGSTLRVISKGEGLLLKYSGLWDMSISLHTERKICAWPSLNNSKTVNNRKIIQDVVVSPAKLTSSIWVAGQAFHIRSKTTV
jgi:hypothetical protein